LFVYLPGINIYQLLYSLFFIMGSRSFVFASSVASLMLLAVLATSLNVQSANAQQDDLWYPGEGVRQDMYVKYRIQEFDTNDNRPYEMTIYFKEQVDGDWIAPTFVVDQGRVYQGTLKLADNMAPLTGEGSDVPDEMKPYISGYSGSLHWLDSFTTKSAPLSLTQQSWGKIASIGGGEIRPIGTQQVSFAGAQDLCGADSCDTTLVQWHKGVDSKVWIVNGFPFPVKAETYVDVTTGQQPIQYAFELLETGTGQPEAPTSAEQAPTPPLSKTTPRGTYSIEIDWDPAEIQPGSTVAFGLAMTESNGFPLQRVNYDFTVKNASGNVVQELANQNAEFGTATHEVKFDSAGPMTVTVKLNSISGQPAGAGTFTESADFNIVVVPEFPISAAIVAGAVIGLLVLVMRARRTTSLGVLFGSRRQL
jgi:hypothetical protein